MKNYFVVFALLVSFAAPPLAAEMIDREFRESFDVSVEDRLDLQFGDGDVVITPWEQDVLEVHVRYRAEVRAIGFSSPDRQDFSVDFERRGTVIRVVGREPAGRIGIGIFTKREHEYLYTVRAPSYLALELQGDDGDVRIEGWNSAIELVSDDGDFDLAGSTGDLHLRLEDGDALIEEHRGSIDLRLDDGDVEISGCEGPMVAIEIEDGDVEIDRCSASLDISADDGDIYLDRVRSQEVDIRTADGDAIVDLDSDGPLQLEVRTRDGDIDLDLGPGVSARFTIDTADGSIRIEGPAAELSRDRTYASGSIGDGRGTIRVVSNDGRVILRHRGSSPPPAERPIGRSR